MCQRWKHLHGFDNDLLLCGCEASEERKLIQAEDLAAHVSDGFPTLETVSPALILQSSSHESPLQALVKVIPKGLTRGKHVQFLHSYLTCKGLGETLVFPYMFQHTSGKANLHLTM